MPRARIRTAALIVTAVLTLAACGAGGADRTSARTPSAAAPTTPPSASSAESSEAARPTTENRVDAALAALTREQQIAQLFVVGVPLDDVHQGDDLAARGVGGIFLAGRSTLAADDLARVTAAWQDAAGATGLWVAADQEGGNVQTLSGPGFPRLPTAQEQGRLPEPQLASLADGLGASLERAGVNLDLAPVADVVPAGTEQSNEPIGAYGRQYGATPAEVSAAVEVVLDGLAGHGVTGVLKHFPGLGRVQGNTDTRAHVVDPRTGADDPSVRLFADLAEGADSPPFVMTSSAVYPAIDGNEPAGWSEQVVDGLLRGRLGFDGVVISDDVGRAAAVQAVPAGERAIRCLDAGGTLVLTVDPALFPGMLAAVAERDRTDDAFRARVDTAVRTALLAKARAGLLHG